MSVLFLAAPLAAYAAGAAPVAWHSESSISIADHGGMPFAEPNGISSRWNSIRLQHDECCTFCTLQPSDASTAVPAGPPKTLDLTSPQFNEWLLSVPLQVLVSDRCDLRSAEGLVGNEPPAAEAMHEIVVVASAPGQLPSATHTPCGIAGIAWSFAHPADAWRELAPLPAASDTVACLRSAAVVEHLPEALGPVRWYQ